jgi:hypothetical protein
MFTNQNYQNGFDNNQDIFYSQHCIGDSQSAFLNPHINQNFFNHPRNFNDNYSSFSSNTCNTSSNSTNASISQMTSLYMANQRKKAFTDEINLCLNKSLEKILPIIAKQTAEVIYNSISQTLIESEKNIRELKNAIDTLRATLQSCTYLTKNSNDMKKINQIYGNLNKVNGSMSNCGILLNNQIKFAQGNEEFKSQQQELINGILDKFEHIKDLLGKQKEFSGKLNECIKTSLANIIVTKTNYKNELIKIQDNIKYDSVNDNENKNLMKQINDISISINDFKNKVDTATDIYFNNNMNNNLKESNNSCSNKINVDINSPNENSDIDKGENSNINTGVNSNKLKKLFSEVNGGKFKF